MNFSLVVCDKISSFYILVHLFAMARGNHQMKGRKYVSLFYLFGLKFMQGIILALSNKCVSNSHASKSKLPVFVLFHLY